MGQSLFKGIKLNGEIVTQQIEGYKQNGEPKDGFWLNGNWYEPGAFECTLSFSSNYYSGGVTFYFTDNTKPITYYVNGTAYTATAPEGYSTATVNKGTNGITSGAILKVYDSNVYQISFIYQYKSTSSKGNVSYLNDDCVDTISHYGQYMSSMPLTMDSNKSNVTRPSKIPCNYINYNNIVSNTGCPYRVSLTSIPTQITILPMSLSDYTNINSSSINIEPYAILWQAANNPNNPLTTLQIKNLTTAAQTSKFTPSKAYLVPISITNIALYTTDYDVNTASEKTRFFSFQSITSGASYVKPNIYVFWDKNGYIKGDSSKPVTNYIGIARTGDDTDTNIYPIIKYWGEWTKQDLINDGYDMNMIDGRYPLPE